MFWRHALLDCTPAPQRALLVAFSCTAPAALQVLRRLLGDGDLAPELRARCLLAACDVLGGQVRRTPSPMLTTRRH